MISSLVSWSSPLGRRAELGDGVAPGVGLGGACDLIRRERSARLVLIDLLDEAGLAFIESAIRRGHSDHGLENQVSSAIRRFIHLLLLRFPLDAADCAGLTRVCQAP